MVTITQPLSTYVDNNDSSTYTLTWTNDNYTGQYAFEILYKIKSSDSWLTTGKIESTLASYDLRNLHDLLGIDLDEIQYRLVVYYKTTDGVETRDFSDAAYIYSLIFNSGSNESLKTYDGKTTSEYPLFSEINNNNIRHMNIQTANGTKRLPLVDNDSPIAGNVKIVVADGDSKITKSFANKSPVFTYDTSKLTTYGTVQSYSSEPIYSTGSYNSEAYSNYSSKRYDGRYYNTAYGSYYTSYYGNKYYTAYNNNYGYTKYTNNVGTNSYYGNEGYYTTPSSTYSYYTYSIYSYASHWAEYRYYGVYQYGYLKGYYVTPNGPVPYGGVGTTTPGNIYRYYQVYQYGYYVTQYNYHAYDKTYRDWMIYYWYTMTQYGPHSVKDDKYYYRYYEYTRSAPRIFYGTKYAYTKYYYTTYSKYYYTTYGYYKYTTYGTYYYRTDSQYYYSYYTTTSYNYYTVYAHRYYTTYYYYYQSGYDDRSYSYTYTVT